MDDTPTPPPGEADAPEMQISQDDGTAERSLPDATRKGPDVPPSGPPVRPRHTPGSGPPVRTPSPTRTVALVDGINPTEPKIREHSILGALTCVRLLTYDQLYDLLFSDLSRKRMRKWIARLAAEKAVTRWHGPPLNGWRGAEYLLPTQETVTRIASEIRVMAGDLPYEGLVRLMLPRRLRALNLDEGAQPDWLQHQTEVNAIVGRIVLSARDPVWFSTWPTPFPKEEGTVTYPQPDYVLVERDTDGAFTIVFGEHDRGTGPVDRFVARKIQLYDEIASLPGVAEQLFGIARFRVDTSVMDFKHPPMERVNAYLEAATHTQHPEIFRFTLAGWLHAYPDRAVWFTTTARPTTDAAGMGAHLPR